MRVPRLFTPQTLSEQGVVELEEGPSHHAIKVLRMTEGRPLILFNGLGGEYSGTITAIQKKKAVIGLHQFNPENRQSPLQIHLAIGLSRGERFEQVLQKATELGVTHITPLKTERTEVKLQGERLGKKMESWHKIIVGTCEQSGRNILPTLTPLTPFQTFVSTDLNERKLVLHHRNASSLNDVPETTSVTVLIGPEGGLSDDEIVGAENKGYQALSLGPRVLRTETAPLTALSLLQFQWGDL